MNEAVKLLSDDTSMARIGLVEYNERPSVKIQFSESSKQLLDLALSSLRSTRKLSKPVVAIDFIRETYFNPSKIKNGAKRSAVILMNGETNGKELANIEKSLKLLNDSSISYILVMIGGTKNSGALVEEKGKPFGKVVLFDSRNQLPEAIPDVSELSREKLGGTSTFLVHVFVASQEKSD